MKKEYNYTNWNPEKHFEYEGIGICPVCRRVGKFEFLSSGQKKNLEVWIHKEHIVESPGVHDAYWDDYCTVEEPEYIT